MIMKPEPKLRVTVNTREQVATYKLGDRVGIEQLTITRDDLIRTVFDISRHIMQRNGGVTQSDHGGGKFTRRHRGAGTVVGVSTDGMHYTVRPDYPWTD